MSNKATLTSTELEVTQKMQTHFPRGLSTKVLADANSCPVEKLTEAIEEMLKKLVDGAKAAVPKLLEFVTSFRTPAVNKFIVADHFKEGETINGVKVAWLNPEFKRLFLSKVETGVEAADIKVCQLARSSKDLGIRSEIGEGNEEIKIAHFCAGLKAHGDGKVGDWLIGYVTGIDGNLWAVNADRYDELMQTEC